MTIKKNVSHQVLLQLVKFWLAMAEEYNSQLITEYTLFKLANIDYKVNSNKQLETESFFLLIESKFNAFLRLEQIERYHKYQVTITFDPATIIQELEQVGYQNKWKNSVIKYVKKGFLNKLNPGNDNSLRFIVKIVKLLINERDRAKYNNILYPDPSMDKLLHYQVEQERIFEQIKIQISQNLNLSEIIQTAINNSCNFLDLDRLVIYQLDVPLKSDLISESVHTIDTVTYEAKKENVASTLYFQEDRRWHNFSQCKSKYRQGFSLVIDDVEQNLDLNPCLKLLMQKFQVKAGAVVPIDVRGKLWGFIIAHQCFETRHWHHQDIKFLRQMAEYIAIAVYHHQSYKQLHQQKKLLEKQVQNQAQQIIDALIAAEAASKSKHEFLGSMSHELRTPLTCVIGLSSTLLQWSSTKSTAPLSPEKQQQYLHLIQQSGKHLLALINNILEFSDVESGKHLLNIKQISLVDIARQSLQMLQETAEAKKITLSSEIKLNIDQEYFFADEIRLKEILFNLLNNGIKFTPKQGEVTLRVWREKRHVVFQVEDTGIGIAPQEIPLLFEKFKQIENFRDRTHGGTGLGLALTKELVELHGGNIEVESALDKGSMFTVSLPVKTHFEPHLNHDSSALRQTISSSPTIVLVTEDEESATFICQLLNTIDCQVVWLMDSIMAMNQIELLQPRLIIIDCDFGLVGINNLTQAIQKSSIANEINLIVLGDRQSNNNQNFALGKVDDYLSKAMNPTQIINKVNKFLKGSQNQK
ncbi:MAG: ATP-binding protein [Pleurocapsa sp.]